MGPLENDAALDVVQAWTRFRAGGYDDDHYTPEGSMDYFLREGLGYTIDWGDVDTTARLIALAELFHRDGLAIRGKVRDYFEEAINWELRKDALDEWDDPRGRRRALEDLLARIGGKKRRITHSKLFRHPAIEFTSQAELLQKLEIWVRGIKAHRLSQSPSDHEYPRLWQVLDRVMKSRIRHLGDTLRLEAVGQRLMLLAAYVGIYLRLSEDDTLKLVKTAKGCYPIFGHATDLWKQYQTSSSARVDGDTPTR